MKLHASNQSSVNTLPVTVVGMGSIMSVVVTKKTGVS